MREAVDEVLGYGHGIEQQGLERIRLDIEPLWLSLAKNSHDRVDRRSLRYVVQRYFLRRYSLSIVGLEANHANSTHSEAALLTNFAPNYVRKVLEGKDAQKGFFIEDAAAMIAALLRLVEHSGGTMLEGVYKSQGMDYRKDVGRKAMGEIMEGFMLRWMLGDDQESIAMLEANATLKEASFEDWRHMAQFVQGRVSSFEYTQSHGRTNGGSHAATWNALRPHFSFADAEAIVGSVALTFGTFWETECANTKDTLAKMDRYNTGRVKLADFHRAALDGEWRFSESKEYLRKLGALDESSSWYGPRVLITNYVQAPSNCIVTSEHYRVCCSNECENFIAELESAVRAPLATPEEVLAVIQPLSFGFNDDTRLTPALKSQLREIARGNSGKVSIHGRLFAQWLHYVFPLECPFPHKSGTTTTLTPLAFGDDYMASEDEMASHAEQKTADAHGDGASSQEDEWMQQWSHEEELLAENLYSQWEADFSTSALGLMFIAGLIFTLMKSGVISTRNTKDVLPTTTCMKSHYV